MHAQEMIASHPHVRGSTNDALIRCIEECYDCAQICTSCADACLGEKEVQRLTQCVRMNLDCADVCLATGALATRRTGSNEQLIARMLDSCAEACRLCAEECEKHASQHKHCRICADACRRCEAACQGARSSIQATRH
ncbi:four-helix bundle copper-binding protein [Desertibaculum subflavum]|uniref:four-helix bundle copper-binding protein n=1 Tax=Desertibaculum subflavum TaxID=2268458 RepID=UPI000E672DCD